jgi:hypothetical protein
MHLCVTAYVYPACGFPLVTKTVLIPGGEKGAREVCGDETGSLPRLGSGPVGGTELLPAEGPCRRALGHQTPVVSRVPHSAATVP